MDSMEKALFIINMQEMFVGKTRDKNQFDYDGEDLINMINKRINDYQPEEVFYIISLKKGLFGGNYPKPSTKEATFPGKLKIVSKNIYQKYKPDAFSSVILEDFVRARNVKEIELVWVDGVDVVSTAQGAIDCGLKVVFNESLIKTMNQDKMMKIRQGLKQNKVSYI